MMRSLLEDEAKSVFEIGPNAMGLDLLRAVYRNSSVELSTRLHIDLTFAPMGSMGQMDCHANDIESTGVSGKGGAM